MYKALFLLSMLGSSMSASCVTAGSNDVGAQACSDVGAQPCPVGLVTGKTIDEEFGAGIHEITRCVKNREGIKIVMQANKACRDSLVKPDANSPTGFVVENHANTCRPGRGYAIGHMAMMIEDWTVTHGIPPEELDLNIVVHGTGGTMLLNSPDNELLPEVRALMRGDICGVKVKFHFCMNTIRGMAKKMTAAAGKPITPADIVKMTVPGVTYITGCLTALPDFQREGYIFLQP